MARLALLAVLLLLVVAMMQAARGPQAVDMLDRLFGAGGNNANAPGQAGAQNAPPQDADSDAPSPLPSPDAGLLQSIEDNTAFLPAESEAWFHLWEILQRVTPEQMARESTGEATYVQLVEQPRAYRGKIVTVRGKVHRTELLAPAENNLGLQQYYRLTLRPQGRQIWPIMVYALHLPENFPQGDDVRTDVTVAGYFFKNWSYAWSEGMGLAPVIMAPGFAWQAPPPPAAGPSAMDSLPLVILAAAGLAVCAMCFVVWKAGRVAEAPGAVGQPVRGERFHAWKSSSGAPQSEFDARHLAEQLERKPS